MSAAFANLAATEEAEMKDKIHFKLSHAGVTRRFALPRHADDLISALKSRVLTIIGTADVQLYWKDEDSLIVLETDDDMHAAIDYAETQNKLGCVALETGEKKEERGEEGMGDIRIVSEKDSKAAFNGFAFMCDACNGYLGPLNGGRFMCTICDNYDLCALCLLKGEHSNHAFVRLLNGDTELPLSNEARGVLSMFTKDVPRCTPTFTATFPARSSDAKMLAANADWIAKELANAASIDELFKSIDEKYKKADGAFMKSFEDDMRKGLDDTPTIHTDATDKPNEQKDQKLEYSRDDMFNIKEDMMMLCLNAQLEKPTSNTDDLNFVQELLKKSEELVDLLEQEDGGLQPVTPAPEQPVDVADSEIAPSELPPPLKKMKPQPELQLQPEMLQQPLKQTQLQSLPFPELVEALKKSQQQPPIPIVGYPLLYPTLRSQPMTNWMQQQLQPQLQRQPMHPQVPPFPSQLHQQPLPHVQPIQQRQYTQPAPQMQLQPLLTSFPTQLQQQQQPMQPPSWMQPQLQHKVLLTPEINPTIQMNPLLQELSKQYDVVVSTSPPIVLGPFTPEGLPYPMPTVPTAQKTFNEPKKEETQLLRREKDHNEDRDGYRRAVREETYRRAASERRDRDADYRGGDYSRRDTSERREHGNDYVPRDLGVRRGEEGRKIDRDSNERRDRVYVNSDFARRRGEPYGNDYVRRDYRSGRYEDVRHSSRDSGARKDRDLVDLEFGRIDRENFGDRYDDHYSSDYTPVDHIDQRSTRGEVGSNRAEYGDYYTGEELHGRDQRHSTHLGPFRSYEEPAREKRMEQRRSDRDQDRRSAFRAYEEPAREQRRDRGFGEDRRIEYQSESDYDDWEPEERTEKPKQSAFPCSLRTDDESDYDRRLKEENEAYMKASQIPAHMVMQVLEECVKLSAEKIEEKLTDYIKTVELNTYFLKEHPAIFVDHYYDDFLIGNVAVDLEKHLRRIRNIVRKEKEDYHRHFDAAYDLLRKALNDNGTNTESYAETARKLRSILLTMEYYRESDNEWDCQFDRFMGFMEADPRNGYENPPRVPSACPEREGMFAPRPRDSGKNRFNIRKLPEHFPN